MEKAIYIYEALISDNKLEEFHQELVKNPTDIQNYTHFLYDIFPRNRTNFLELLVDEYGIDPYGVLLRYFGRFNDANITRFFLFVTI